ncbi:phosphatase PAP2 family protein [Rubellimicrobium aerolatum]|uniref:Phosphatase PAP2 family protein n=1 Tax=Rubellimicrobium aerolatum TaxID=490979 RepID=A0ABW0SAN4_9RHOB|nr:phosphatase PAP2 family protein [Rubellimicrobium aerolatum]MBP1806123.1 membrane-associated phospholipid phosphatase [Rubellimicrobium aerolatum]
MSLQDTIETIEEADLAVAEAAAEVRHHPVTRALGHLSEVADQPPMFALGALTLAAGLLADERRLAEAGGRLLASVALATAVKSVVKAVVVRTRPHVLADGGEYESGLLGRNEGPWNSFPSGHTADAVAAARAVARVWPGAAVPLYGAAAAIGVAQVPRCAHYPSDVTAGALVGWAAEATVDRAWPAAEPLLDAARAALHGRQLG